MSSTRMTTFIAGLALFAALCGGWSFHASVGEPGPQSGTTTSSEPLTVDKDRLAALAKQKLEEAAGQEAAGVECEGDIAGQVGATQRCALTAVDGTKIGVTAPVTGVKADDVSLDFKADDGPQ